MSYMIKRFYQNHESEVVATGLSLEAAQERCGDPETSSRTATGDEAEARTAEFGAWFEGYEEQ